MIERTEKVLTSTEREYKHLGNVELTGFMVDDRARIVHESTHGLYTLELPCSQLDGLIEMIAAMRDDMPADPPVEGEPL